MPTDKSGENRIFQVGTANITYASFGSFGFGFALKAHDNTAFDVLVSFFILIASGFVGSFSQ